MFSPRALPFGDALCFALFVLIGDISHQVSGQFVRSFLQTGLPVLALWFLVAPFLGTYRMVGYKTWVPAWFLSVLFGVITRFLILDKPFDRNFVIFLFIGLVFTFIFLWIWRALYRRFSKVSQGK